MRPYYKLLELVSLAEAFFKFIRDPTSKDYDHIIPKLDDALKGYIRNLLFIQNQKITMSLWFLSLLNHIIYFSKLSMWAAE